MITQAPELWDGGYWYRVPAVQDEDGVWTVPFANFAADYDGDDGFSALVRVPEPPTVKEFAQNSLSKFFARVGGV